MKTKSTAKVKDIESEIIALRSYIIGVAGKDKEGNYRPEFVKKVLSAVRDKTDYKFENPEKFIKQYEQH